jgi:hypothetical protein
VKRFLIILMSCFSAINAGELAIQKFPSYYKLSSKEFNADIPNYMVSKQVRSMDPTKLAAVLNSGNAYLDINECSDGQYFMDIKGRVRGGGPVGAIEGAAAGGIIASEGSKMIFVCGSVACLFLAQGAVHIFGGADKGAVFRADITNRFLPAVYAIAENVVGPACGMVGAGVGAVAGSAAPI